jgi:hypothetical protein
VLRATRFTGVIGVVILSSDCFTRTIPFIYLGHAPFHAENPSLVHFFNPDEASYAVRILD